MRVSGVKKSWLISGVLAFGALVLILGGEDEEAPEDTADRSKTGAPTASAPAAAPGIGYRVREREAPVFTQRTPQPSGWRFRPLDDNDRAREQRQTRSAWPGAAPSAPPVQPAPRFREAPPASAPAPAYSYRFRPLEQREKEGRYTGNFPEPFHPGTLAPVIPAPPQGPGGYAAPWGRGDFIRMSADNGPYYYR
jgi:hypothetical protein